MSARQISEINGKFIQKTKKMLENILPYGHWQRIMVITTFLILILSIPLQNLKMVKHTLISVISIVVLELRNNAVGFEVCGKDDFFYKAEATIEGNQIVLYAKNVKTPIKARYGWSNWVDASLFNKYWLSAPTFRTYTD